MAKVFLYAPKDFRNLCVLARTLEVLGHPECYVFDPHRLVRDHYGKARSREMRVVSAGSFNKVTWKRIEEPERFLAEYNGRLVATVADPRAAELTGFRFFSSDLLLFGPESAGLPPKVLSVATASVTIPRRGQTQSLNVAVALGIVLFEAQRQMRADSATQVA